LETREKLQTGEEDTQSRKRLETDVKTVSNFKLLYFNAQGMSNKFVQFNTLLHSKEYDTVAVSETWFDSSVLNSELIISGNTCFHQDGRIELFDDEPYVKEAWGGVIILVKEDSRPDLVDFDVGAELIS